MHHALNGIKVVGFDLWATLFRGMDPEYKARRGRYYIDVLGLVGYELNDVHRLTKLADDHFNELAEHDGNDYPFVPRFMRFCESVDVPRMRAEAYCREVYAFNGLLLAEYPPLLTEDCIVSVFTALRKRGYRLALYSNTGNNGGDQLRVALQAHRLLPLFERVFFSNESGVSKPNPRVFGLMADTLHVRPEEILYIGDNPRADYHGATNAGCKALHYDPKGVSTLPRIGSFRELLG